MHAMLVQALAGNAVVAKTPTDGGLACLTLGSALAVREGLPFTLISGSGSKLAPALVAGDDISCVFFVGGRQAGSAVERLIESGKRYVLEQEGLNCWGVWEFSDWDLLASHIRKGFDYAKQRCTAYPRYVVQRSLFDKFLATYLPILDELNYGHPLAVEQPDDEPPVLDFGPLINATKVKELTNDVEDAISRGGVPLYRGSLDRGRFLPGQETTAYFPPASVLAPPQSSTLFHAEPFGPVDTIVLVDTEAELLAEMNASTGSLVASIACDDEDTAQRLGRELQAFKVGINKPRSRGDREEHFGGKGASWRGAFVGGALLVRAVTDGEPGDYLHGNFSTYSLYPER
jgi:acyl-CoA reductase-like NAD-dependent aldehyde dehydrogenase